ncbi:phage lytic cycle repressor MrpR family protein [Paenibacillus cymbidii]|uniref:phage lytic cycle repressor MrpR family protein n=1 Tax=Paenibacillus cymbidii TaxID=1639034 RepID=UPI001081EAD9|nr:integrase [Paenibacillus cymbidii]
MANVIYQHGFYNETVKNDYLLSFQPATSRTFSRLFKASQALEAEIGKDLYDFDEEQLCRLLRSLAPAKRNASRQNGSTLANYLDWALQRNLRRTNNPLHHVAPAWYDQFVDGSRKQYFTEDELETIVAGCRNAQDAVLIKLLMEGVGGDGNSELLNLTIHDIHPSTNELTLRSADGCTRKLTVSKACIALCLRAHAQSTYLRRNGQVSKRAKVTTANLVVNDFIIRSSVTQTGHLQHAQKNIVHRRMSVLAELFGFPGLIPKNIAYSGMLILARDLLERDGKLEKPQYDTICEVFNVSQSHAEGKAGYQYYRLKNEFLHRDKVIELYGDVITKRMESRKND